LKLETRNVRGQVLQKCGSQGFRGQDRERKADRLSSMDVENPVCLPRGCREIGRLSSTKKAVGELRKLSGQVQGENRKLILGRGSLQGEEYGTGFSEYTGYTKEYKVLSWVCTGGFRRI